jgi:hypothetical protein
MRKTSPSFQIKNPRSPSLQPSHNTDYANLALPFQLNDFQNACSKAFISNEFHVCDAILKVQKFTPSVTELLQPARGTATVG